MQTTMLFTSPANIGLYKKVSRALASECRLKTHLFAADGAYQDLPFECGDHASPQLLDEHMPPLFYNVEDWALSQEGEATFNRLVDQSIEYFKLHGHCVAPAHDLRHMLVKDMAEALRFAEEGFITGYKRFFLIASLWHDMGRLLEAHYDEAGLEPAVKVPHAILSYGLMKEFLAVEAPSMPKPLREQLLYAVQNHSGGNATCFIGRAVQRADRFQLLGAEGMLRTLAYDGGVCGYPLRFDPEPTQINTVYLESLRAIPNIVDYLGRNLYGNLSFDFGERERILRAQSQALVRMMLTSEEQNILMRTAIGVTPDRPHEEDIQKQYYAIMAHLDAQPRETPDMIALLSKSGNAPLSEKAQANLIAAYEALPPELQEYMGVVLKACDYLQAEGDAQDYAFLSGLVARKGERSAEGKLARLAIELGELGNGAGLEVASDEKIAPPAP